MAEDNVTVRLVQTGAVEAWPAWAAERLIECGQAVPAPAVEGAPVNRAELTGGRPPLALPPEGGA